MKRLSASLIGFILVAALTGPAAADIDLTFEAVDEVSRVSDVDYFLHIRGIPQGQSEAVEVVARVVTATSGNGHLELAASCERMALVAASRPGRYLFRIVTMRSNNQETLDSCRLIRR